MHLLGCLFFLLFFLLIFGMALVGSVIDGVWRLLTGGRRPYSHTQEEPQQRRQTSSSAGEAPASYTFRPEDGEYIDYEEVRD
ncbi:MAG: DUF4834 family protein [Bacteroidaceae bacterium]|nr:DUF4834 family protein [Bacteroidaceae bacterium]